ncbi:MAG: Uncharacterised protein [Opitutia bacterium UBA7350]|nr:MAG: Uncharacterised protein [Opitutae bacterium UBA7350]
MSDHPKKSKPSTVLETILADDGPMPAAHMGIRILAFILDFVLCLAIATILIWKIILPASHPGIFLEFNAWTEQLLQWLQNTESTIETMPRPGKDLLAALRHASEIQLLIFWAYFGLGEIFLAGSLGKRACRLRTVSTLTLGALNPLAAFLRAGVKTAACFFLFPICFIANLIALCFNARRQLGHDLIARTAVIDEKYLKNEPYTQS